MRLIDADALLKALKTLSFPIELDSNVMTMFTHDVVNAITNAPTVQREGWVSVDDTLRVEFEKVAEKYKLNLSRSKHEDGNYESARTNDYWWFYKEALQNLPAAPTDKE